MTIPAMAEGAEGPRIRNRTRTRPALLTLAATLVVAGCAAGPGGDAYDLLITGGTIVDGTGADRYVGDVAIRDGRVELVGDVGGAQALDTLDATGLIVAPGFIDVHNHTEQAITEPERKLNEGFVRQGVTLIFGGPDGSAGPWDIRRAAEAYAANGIGTNVAFYVGHNAVRDSALAGDKQRAPTAEELEAMKAFVKEGMELGAFGLSTGLMYEPGMFSETAEVIELAKVVAPYGGVYDSHVRDPVSRFLESDQEVIDIAEAAGIPGKIGHEKAVGLHNEGKIQDVIAMVEAARARGSNITADQYPYDGAATASLRDIIVVPPGLEGVPGERPARRGENDPEVAAAWEAALKQALRDPARRARLKDASENGVDGGFAWLKATGYNSMRVTSSRDYPELVGVYLSEIAEREGKDPFDAVAELYLGAEHPVGITLGAIKDQDVRDLMVQPWNMIASDGAWADGSDAPGGHPRSAGTFPRFLGYWVREQGLLSLEEGVRKITSLPAEFHGIADRGRLAAGQAADIAVFDAETIIDRADWDHPNRFSEGVVHVVVNGVPVLRDGAMTGEAPGVLVKHQPAERIADSQR